MGNPSIIRNATDVLLGFINVNVVLIINLVAIPPKKGKFRGKTLTVSVG